MMTARHTLAPAVLGALALAAFVTSAGCRSRDRGWDRERPATVTQPDSKDPNEADRSGTTNLTGAAWIANTSAIDKIVASRCARELTCSNLGPDKHFMSSDLCVAEVRRRMEGDLSSNECPMGVDGKGLDECLDAIRSESCTNPLETVSRIAACRAGALCLKSDGPHR